MKSSLVRAAPPRSRSTRSDFDHSPGDLRLALRIGIFVGMKPGTRAVLLMTALLAVPAIVIPSFIYILHRSESGWVFPIAIAGGALGVGAPLVNRKRRDNKAP